VGARQHGDHGARVARPRRSAGESLALGWGLRSGPCVWVADSHSGLSSPCNVRLASCGEAAQRAAALNLSALWSSLVAPAHAACTPRKTFRSAHSTPHAARRRTVPRQKVAAAAAPPAPHGGGSETCTSVSSNCRRSFGGTRYSVSPLLVSTCSPLAPYAMLGGT